MSPEQDAKMFLSTPAPQGVFPATAVEPWLAAWRKVSGAYWSGSYEFLPKDLTKEEREIAMQEIRAMPDVFYTTFQVPVITPDNCKE